MASVDQHVYPEGSEVDMRRRSFATRRYADLLFEKVYLRRGARRYLRCSRTLSASQDQTTE